MQNQEVLSECVRVVALRKRRQRRKREGEKKRGERSRLNLSLKVSREGMRVPVERR